MAIIAGLAIEKTQNRALQYAGMAAGIMIDYSFGTAWFCLVMDSDVIATLGLCAFPFVPGAMVKILLAMSIGSLLRKRLAGTKY